MDKITDRNHSLLSNLQCLFVAVTRIFLQLRNCWN